MTPNEFDEACRNLWRLCSGLTETSGRRSASRNLQVGGAPKSKHLLGMARDYTAGQEEELQRAGLVAKTLGLWYQIHDKGSGLHLHVQGLPPGPLENWWEQKYVRKG